MCIRTRLVRSFAVPPLCMEFERHKMTGQRSSSGRFACLSRPMFCAGAQYFLQDYTCPSEDSDQPERPRSLIWGFAVHLKTIDPWLPHNALWTLVRLNGCAGWPEFNGRTCSNKEMLCPGSLSIMWTFSNTGSNLMSLHTTSNRNHQQYFCTSTYATDHRVTSSEHSSFGFDSTGPVY